MKLLLVILFLFSIYVLPAQEIGDFDYEFTSLAKAEENPDLVYHLNLTRKKLDEIPEVIFTFYNLRSLNLKKNKISQIPPRIGQLIRLEKLNLANNKIYSIPPQVGKLKELTHLYLARNKIEKLPAQLGDLNNLRELDVWLNNIKEIDRRIFELKQLTLLNLSGMLLEKELKEALIKNLPETKILLTDGCNCAY